MPGEREVLVTSLHGTVRRVPEDVPDLSAFSEPGVFALYRAILSELKHRGVIRTENAPVGDYAEYLVAIGSSAASNRPPAVQQRRA